MSKSSKSATSDIELHPDAWERFERAAGVVAKSPPQHRKSIKKKIKMGSAKKTKPRDP
jgi:hypothetical protein